MLTRLTIKLDTDTIAFFKGSVMQGVLFEQLDSEYADWLHRMQIHPYSQYIKKAAHQKDEWIINTLNEQAASYILSPMLDPDFKRIKIRKGNIEAAIISKEKQETDAKQLWKDSQRQQSSRDIKIEFMTPTAFKQAGHYSVLPEPRLIFQSLINKYKPIADHPDFFDEELLQNLTESAEILSYRLRTVKYPLERITVPGFMGSLTVSLKGSKSLRQIAEFLVRFGEFSGVGIKTAMGMGAIHVLS